jgi:3-deoxy-manno-octulosonate cytidylyltransferase (CMP-KDO synthetase)
MRSSRLPEKVLADIAGKPMVQHVYEKALQAEVDDVFITTESKKVAEVAEGFGAKVIFTDPDHPSGSSRLAEAVQIINANDDDVILNLQGDEPLIPVENLNQVMRNLEIHSNASVTTLCELIENEHNILDPSCVKVVIDVHGYALYFSRAAIPHDRDKKHNVAYFRHIGLYCYRAAMLKHYDHLDASTIEEVEVLEQLRFLFHGIKIHVDVAQQSTPPGVDTPDDLARVRVLINKE